MDLGRDDLGRHRRKILTVHSAGSFPVLIKVSTSPNEKILLRDWLDRWMREVIKPHLRQVTRERYRSIINLHIALAIGNVVLSGALKHALYMEFVYRNPGSLVSPPPAAWREIAPPDISVVCYALDEGWVFADAQGEWINPMRLTSPSKVESQIPILLPP